MISLALMLLTATPFPLPAIGDKPPAIAAHQTEFRLPMRFEKVRAFYAAQFPAQTDGVTTRASQKDGRRMVILSSARKTDEWTRAIIMESESSMETTIRISRVIQVGPLDIEGNGRPLVQFVFQRSGEVESAVEAIGEKHLEQVRK